MQRMRCSTRHAAVRAENAPCRTPPASHLPSTRRHACNGSLQTPPRSPAAPRPPPPPPPSRPPQTRNLQGGRQRQRCAGAPCAPHQPTHLQGVAAPEAARVAAAGGQADGQADCFCVVCRGLGRQACRLAAQLSLQSAARRGGRGEEGWGWGGGGDGWVGASGERRGGELGLGWEVRRRHRQ